MSAVLVHGMPGRDEYFDPEQPSASNAHWFPWLQNQLLIRGIPATTPEMPDAWRPDYTVWRRELERFDIAEDTLLVGHSCGGGFLVRWLSEHPEVRVGRVVLVAPWLDPQREDTTTFFEFSLDPDLASRTNGLVIFNSEDDTASIQTSVGILQQALPGTRVRSFTRFGHFTYSSMGRHAFPELLDELLLA